MKEKITNIKLYVLNITRQVTNGNIYNHSVLVIKRIEIMLIIGIISSERTYLGVLVGTELTQQSTDSTEYYV